MTDVTIKATRPMRVAESTATAPGFGHEDLGPVWGDLMPKVANQIMESSSKPLMCVGWYEPPKLDGKVQAHIGFEVGAQRVKPDPEVEVIDLPSIEVASILHRGGLDDITETYDELFRWIDASEYKVCDDPAVGYSRELYIHFTNADSVTNVTEIQIPITH